MKGESIDLPLQIRCPDLGMVHLGQNLFIGIFAASEQPEQGQGKKKNDPTPESFAHL
jgi:hypothetical protein